jgi:phage-related protein
MSLPIVGNTNLLSPFAGNNKKSGEPTIPGLARSQVPGTNIDKSNNSLAHNCGISQELIKNNALKDFINSQSQNIRDLINIVIKALGFDPTGTSSNIVSLLKQITAKIKYYKKKILKPIQDFQKYVIKYTQYLNATIAWILSLPAKLLALFKDCLNRLYQLLAGIFSDVLGGADSGLKDTIDAAKELAQTAINSTTEIASAVTSLPTNIAAAISAPPSAESIEAAGKDITDYFNSLPSAEEANAGNQKSKSP